MYDAIEAIIGPIEERFSTYDTTEQDISTLIMLVRNLAAGDSAIDVLATIGC